MTQPHSPLQSIADTALWMAAIRAEENTRNDALFRDPFAHRLVGARYPWIASMLHWSHSYAWAVVVRTCLFDWCIAEHVGRGVDTVVNLGAGLDTRPYRMNLPRPLHWIEVDHPEVFAYKETVLRRDRPYCSVERVPLDLTLSTARRSLFDLLGGISRRALVVSEGLVLYLAEDEVSGLAADLATQRRFRWWILDLVSPEVVCMLRLATSYPFGQLSEAFRFGPGQGADFFTRYGWCPIDVRSVLKTATYANRLPLVMRYFPMLPVWLAADASQPWFSVCLFENECTIDDGRQG
jgi:methyltransferase (TIGR00027 family)